MPAFEEPLHVGRPNVANREKFQELVDGIFERGWFTNDGPLVQQFEREVADFLNVKHCVAMCNGTLALEIAIRAAGLKDEVIVPSYTFVATAHALYWQGITPVFADIDPATHTLDAYSVRRMITPRTTGIIPVHLWGRPADTEAIEEIADEHGLSVLYDAAHAFAVSHNGTMIGNFGRAEVLSFHATKFFNAFEGGAIVTNDDELANAARLMRNFGFGGWDNVIHPGTNGKMTEVCAAMGLANFSDIDNVISGNRANHHRYTEAFESVPGISVMQYDEAEARNFHYVVAEVDDDHADLRDSVVDALHAENVLARKYFWPGAHRMQPYRDLFPNAGLLLPHTERVARKVIVLPNGSSVGDHEVSVITEIIGQALKG